MIGELVVARCRRVLAGRRRGGQYGRRVSTPDADRIVRLLSPGTIWRRPDVVWSTGSTNADLAARARDGETEGAVVVASEQTAGRGRLDRAWSSPPGTSLSMSLLLTPRPEFPRWGWLSLLAGMAVSSAVAQLATQAGVKADVTLKWPNDVLIGGDKVCGILSERIEHPAGARAVVGIGVNVAQGAGEFPVPTATSLALASLPTDRDRIVAAILTQFDRYYRSWQRTGTLRAEYEARCASIGADLTVILEDRRVVGTGRGVDDTGRLQVATPSGIETFAVGDVVHAGLARRTPGTAH